jgi:beta-lactamase regulating signal transducer with metallopeptidase domain
MERHTIAYLILALMIAVAIGWGCYIIYYGRERTYRRRQAREKAQHEARLAVAKSSHTDSAVEPVVP